MRYNKTTGAILSDRACYKTVLVILQVAPAVAYFNSSIFFVAANAPAFAE